MKVTNLDIKARRRALNLQTRDRALNIPDLGRFVATVDDILSKDPGEFAACRQAFLTLAQTNFIKQLVDHELNKFAQDPTYVPLMGFSSEIIVASSERFQLGASIINQRTVRRTGRIASIVSESFLAAAGSPLTIARFRQPRAFPCNMFRRDALLDGPDIVALSGNEILALQPGVDVVEFRPQSEGTTLLLDFWSENKIEYAWEYDIETKAPVRWVPADQTWSRVDYAVKIIETLNDRDSLPTLHALLDHPAHFVRWSAVKAIVSLDFDSGLAALQKAVRDNHAHVRDAAIRTIAQFESAQIS